MDEKKFIRIFQSIFRIISVLLFATAMLIVGGVYYHLDPELLLFVPKKEITASSVQPDYDLIENGIHVRTGLIAGDNVMLVVQNCTSCHSAKMITQNRATKEGWLSMIKWMQQTQNLWDLGANEEKIINYLAANYSPQKKGRRARLKNIEWYELD